jgi:cytoskeletal protein RodZ
VYDDEEEPRSSAPVVISIIIGLVVLIAGILIYQFVYKPKQLAKAKQELVDKEKADAAKKAEEERLAKQAEEERMKREAEAKAKPAEGAIETLSQRTGRYCVIIASSIDGDLVMDQAKKLSAKGVGSKIIPPFGKWKFFRLGIGDFDSFSSAQSSADASKAEYGSALWVMKY